MNFKSILIVTYGRSGSTLLQGLLDSYEGIVIRGENYLFIWRLFISYKRLIETLKHSKAMTPQKPFYGANLINIERFLTDAWILIKNQLFPDIKLDQIKAIGYKEIRYIDLTEKEFYDFLNFQKELFPKPVCFIFLFRNHDSVTKSGWWANFKPDEVKKKLINFENRALKFHSENRKSSFVIKYEDIISINENLKKLIQFLGLSFDKKRIEKVLETPHSYNQRIYKEDKNNENR